MKPKLNFIGLAGIPVGGILSGLGLPWLGFPILFAGAFLFSSFYDTAEFVDYCTFENSQHIVSVRIRHYIIPLILLGKVNFIYKTSYYKVISDNLDLSDVPAKNLIEMTATEYKKMISNQRQQYSNGLVPKEIIVDLCSPDVVCFKQRKFKYILCLVLTILSAMMLFEPDPAAIFLAVLYGGLFGWLLIIRKTEYEEAKIKKAAYERYFPQ